MAYRNSAIAFTNSGNSLTATPAGVQAGDYLGGALVSDTAAGSITLSPPSGWVKRASAATASGAPDGSSTIYADKIAAGGDSFAFTWTGNANGVGLITAAWSGRDPVAPLRVAAPTENTVGNATPVTLNLAGATVQAGDDVAWFVLGDQTIVSDVWVFTAPTNYTERQDSGDANFNSVTLATRDNVPTGVESPLSGVATRSTGSGTFGYLGYVIAIVPAGSTAPWVSQFDNAGEAVPLQQRMC